MKKVLSVIFIVLLSMLVFSCGRNESQPPENHKPQEPSQSEVEASEQNEVGKSDKPAIAGICLGETSEKVEDILGKNYAETYIEEGGYYGEPYFVREYDDGISLIVGKDSDKVLEINLNSDKYQTWLGDKIGATADEVLTKYRKEFTEPESIHTNEKLEGWFDLGDGVLIIFDFDKDDEMIVNTEISSDSKVELIKLTNMMYMD
jgi:hypothetical protein